MPDSPSKGGQFAALIEDLLEDPAADHAPGWCRECDREVSIDLNLRPYGMAESCEEHQPLCWTEPGGC